MLRRTQTGIFTACSYSAFSDHQNLQKRCGTLTGAHVFSTASARRLMPDFPAKWQLVSPRTGSCYQPESTARLINLIDLHWLENKLFEQLCLSDPISWPKSQKTILNLCKRVCTCVLILGVCEGKPKNVVHWSFISFFSRLTHNKKVRCCFVSV